MDIKKQHIFIAMLLFLFLLFFILFYLYSSNEQSSSDQLNIVNKETISDILGTQTTNESGIVTFLPDEEIIEDVEDFTTRDDRVIDIISPSFEEGVDERRLVRIFKDSVAGYRIDKSTNNWIVSVVEQGEGNRYRISTSPYSISKVGGGEFIKVKKAEIFSNNSSLLLYENPIDETSIKSSFVAFNSTISSDQPQSFEDDIITTRNENTLLFFTKKINNENVGFLVDVDRPSNTKVVWRSGFSSWIPRWERGSLILIQTPISKFTKGYSYLINTLEEGLPIFRPVEPRFGGGIYFDESSEYYIAHESRVNNFFGESFVRGGDDINIKIPLTLPEKCDGFNAVFICGLPDTIPKKTISGYDTIYPDSWYQGDLLLNDAIYIIDGLTGSINILLSPEQDDYDDLTGNIALDVINPYITDQGEYLFFINKHDSSLWRLRIDF